MRTCIFESSRICFSMWQEEDYPLALKLWSDKQVCKYITKNGFFTEQEIKEKLRQQIQNYNNCGFQYFPVFYKDTYEFIGCCGFRGYNENTIEFGIHLLPDFWGKGLASEAGLSALKYAFSQLNIENIFAGHNPNNTASAKMLKKLGFILTKKEYYPPTGLMHSSYNLNKNDFIHNTKIL